RDPQEQYKKLERLELNSIKKKEYRQINCPKCDRGIKGENINLNDKIAKCNPCGILFSVKEEVNQLMSPAKAKHELIRPEGIDLFYFKDELDISLQQPVTTLEGVLGGIGIPFAIFFTIAFLISADFKALMAALFFGLMSVYPIYTWMKRKENKIFISISDRFLNIEWRPKKGNKDQCYETEDIDQIYVRKNPNTLRYDVYAIINAPEGQKHIRLLHHLENLSKARYLEQEIEKHLGIENRKVLEEDA
ncbi:MAG: hypothetical protein AAF985_17745, partial [Bacteroidota bacterium]